MRTRSAAPSETPDGPSASQSVPPQSTPCKTFILPSAASDDARFVQLPNPQSGELTRYFFCPRLGVYEFTVIKPPSHAPRSILFTQTPENTNQGPPKGTISKAAELLVATPIDILFFLIPILSPSTTQSKALFQPLDDIIDSQVEFPGHLRHVVYNDTFGEALLPRAEAICDSVEAGDEKMLRFSETKLLQELLAKAERMVAHGLPPTIEERFIRQALATPLMAVKRENPSANDPSDGNDESQEGKETPSTSNTASTSASTPSEKSVSTPATESTPLDEDTNSAEVTNLLRISTALKFLKESYIHEDMRTRLDELLATPETLMDFKPLQDRLAHVAKLRAEALASRSLGDFSRKRGFEDDDAAESRAETKRRKEEEEKKKKAGESRGVKDLKKVNTSGMMKMSSFFAKAPAKKKS
ncbi:hypothetical protein FE257_007602 [Aspergillus nanangensis]|uniref:Ribonuclease H2 subunit B n=1 Tax=Aspergillus nanangensis TaxID=2582783 RepID=A0AAD4CNS1_ASPNN|nr:hypothetical protein FE257_007602 [Aspergillus nanangensis]